jgi:predicted transcriptional regulator of viral defense system
MGRQKMNRPLVADVLAVAREHDWVCPALVAEQLGVERKPVGKALCRLAERGQLIRVKHGRYTVRVELKRQALIQELAALA